MALPALAPSEGSTAIIAARDPDPYLRGVNIGGWLVLEKWMTPEIFSGTDAADQFTFDATPGAEQKLQTHWNTFFTEADVQKIKATGINALRIPIGFWAYDNAGTPYLKGADAYLEKAIVWARNAGLRVWIDCHGSPGSQNGFDNSGHAGAVQWQQGDNIIRSISVLMTMARKYGTAEYADTVVGLELVNEPISWGANNLKVTRSFAAEAYSNVMSVVTNKNLVVVMHDAFQGAGAWTDLPATAHSSGNLGVDSHLYQCFVDDDSKLTQQQHIKKACGWGSDLSKAKAALPTFVGEWSPVTNICVNPDSSTLGGSVCTISGCQCSSDKFETWKDPLVQQVRRYVEAQLDTFEGGANGYFMWSYKAPGAWGFMNGIEKGIIPNPVTSRKYPGQCSA